MAKNIVYIEGHYEVYEAPFSRTYKWQPTQITLECNCGEELMLAESSLALTCRGCGADHSAIIQDIQAQEGRLPNKTLHPWLHDGQEQADQHQRDDAIYPEGSSWRYNDVTSGDEKDV